MAGKLDLQSLLMVFFFFFFIGIGFQETFAHTMMYYPVTISKEKIIQASQSEVVEAKNPVYCAMRANFRHWCHLFCYEEKTCTLYNIILQRYHKDNTQDTVNFCKTNVEGCVMDNKIYNQGDVITKNYQSLVCGERSWLQNPEDVNECLDDKAFQCEENEECVDTRTGYECQCQEGYHREDNTCQDVNECLDDEAFQCEDNLYCFNTDGGYNCQCQEGYYRKGNTCQACFSPSLYLEDLGCISVISDQMKSWDDMKTKCQAEGKRLLEGIKYKHLQPLVNHYSVLGYYHHYWIGMKDSRWITSGEEVTNDLWRSGEPDGGNQVCVYMSTHPSSPGLGDYTCSSTEYALCQSLPPY